MNIAQSSAVGFEVNENVFYQKGQWQGHYTPLNMRKAPFSVTATSKELDQFALCLDESSELVSATEGEALFTDSGEQSDFLKAKQKEITALIEKTFITDALIKLLIEKDFTTMLSALGRSFVYPKRKSIQRSKSILN